MAMPDALAPTATPVILSRKLHSSLLGIATAMEQSESERKKRLDLVKEFLEVIDAWARVKEKTDLGTLVTPFIKNIAPFVQAFATGTKENVQPPQKKKNIVAISFKPVFPTLPARPGSAKPKSWASIAHKAATLPEVPLLPKSGKPNTIPKPVGISTPKEDKRLFLRLAIDHEWRKISPAALKKTITDRAGVAMSAVTAIYSVRSGFAIECVSDAIRESIIRIGTTFKTENAVIEAASDWTSVIVSHVPLSIRTLEGSIPVTKDMVIEECQTVCGVTPVMARPSKVKLGQSSTSWLIHFKQQPAKLGFRLFDESGPAMAFTRRRPIEQCQRCWGFHSTRGCTKAQRCGKCNGVHETSECQMKVPKCANCGGPHEATDLKCMARPRRHNGVITPRTPAEKKIIRERGHRDFSVALAKLKRDEESIRTEEATSSLEANMLDI